MVRLAQAVAAIESSKSTWPRCIARKLGARAHTGQIVRLSEATATLVVQEALHQAHDLCRPFLVRRVSGVQQFEARAADLTRQALAEAGGPHAIVATPNDQGGGDDARGLGHDSARVDRAAQCRERAAAGRGCIESVVVAIDARRRDVRCGAEHGLLKMASK